MRFMRNGEIRPYRKVNRREEEKDKQLVANSRDPVNIIKTK